MNIDPRIINLILSPFRFFLSLVSDNIFGVGDTIVLIITLSAVYRFLLKPIVGGGSGSDEVKKGKK